MPRQQLMTQAEFVDWFGKQRNDVYLTPPYHLMPCSCGDVNCHGWRFVATRGVETVAPRPAIGFRYVGELEPA